MNWYYVKVANTLSQTFTLLSQLMFNFLSEKKGEATLRKIKQKVK